MSTDPAHPDESTPEPMPPDPQPDHEEWLPPAPPLEVDEPEAIPLVLPESAPMRRPPRAQPHFGWAMLWNLGFAVVLFGTMLAIVLVAAAVLAVRGELGPGVADQDAIPRPLAETLAISIPIAYFAGLVFAVIALRLVVGRSWPRQIGLRRPPLMHVVLVIVGLPAFVLASDAVARLLIEVFGSAEEGNQEKLLRDLFLPFPWWFAVLAIGVGPGVVEELWCRGFLGRGLVGRYGWPLGIALTSLFFGLLHVLPPWYVVVTATMGVGLHLVYLASRSLWVPILLHTLNNSISALASIGLIPLDRLERNAAAAPFLVWLLAAGLLVFVGVAMTTGRVRLVPLDPTAPAWEPPFPGVAHPPPGVNAELRMGAVNKPSVGLAIAASAALVYLLVR